jgi:hypothetical protein
MQKLKHLLIEQQTKCPIATQDIDKCAAKRTCSAWVEGGPIK